MIDQFLDSNVAYAIGGGIVYSSIFAFRAVQGGESFDPIKFGLTVVLGGLLGLAFEIAGHDPGAYEWFVILFSFSGMIAGIEQSVKLTLRGYYDEARDTAADALEEGAETAAKHAGGPRNIEREATKQLPENLQPEGDIDDAYRRAAEDSGGWTEPAHVEEGRQPDSDDQTDSNETITSGA